MMQILKIICFLLELPPTKKPKMSTSLHHGNAMNRFSSLESPTSRMSPTIPDSNAPCIDCPPDDLVDRVTKHFESNKDQVEVEYFQYWFLLC